jgi:hypothetical protein
MTVHTSSDKIIRITTIVLLIAAPLSIALVSPAWVNAGPALCPHKLFTGADCMGCGLTRAMVALLHGHPSEAFAYNKGIVVAAPVLAFFWLKELRWHCRALMSSGSPDSEGAPTL